jgi:hypothetical protein
MTRFNEIAATNDTDDTDLLLIWKASLGSTKTITQSNFIKSIGNTSVNGFTATSDTDNKVILTAANETVIDKYYNGMRISFISPIESDGTVQIKIGSLVYKDLFQYGTNETSILEENKYIEAVYIGNADTGKFYRTNISNLVGYTSEYKATGVISGDESTTTLTLISAIGTLKQSYYEAMILMFTSPVNSKGSVQVNVDGLGLKNLNEGEDDVIANNLYTGELITATYDGTQFIKHRSAVTNPPLPIPDPTIEEDALPEEYNLTVTVGTFGQFASIRDAINGLIRDFGDDGGNRKATIRLKTGFIIKEQLFFERCDYSWITLSSEDTTVQLDVSYITIKGLTTNNTYNFIFVNNGKSINLNLKLVKTGNFAFPQNQIGIISVKNQGEITLTDSKFTGFLVNYIIRSDNSTININDTVLEGVALTLPDNNSPRCLRILSGSILNINNVQINGAFNISLEIESTKVSINNFSITGANNQYGIQIISAGSNITCDQINISNCVNGISYNYNNILTFKNTNISNCTIGIVGNSSQVTFLSSNIETSTTSSARAIDIQGTVSWGIYDSTIKGYASQVIAIQGTSKNVTLTNCRVISPADSQGLVVTQGSEVNVAGGDYRTVTNQTLASNIIATGQGTIIRLTNSPIGGTTATSGAQIINN